MFKNLNKRKLSQIVLILMALISLVITIRIIKDQNLDLSLKSYLNYSLIESKVENKPKIFCMITTRVTNHPTKTIAVKNTWAKRCDQFLFLSSEDNETLPAIKVCDIDDRSHLWCKTKSGLKYIYDKYYNQFDWFLKADDDTYVIIDNLKSFLSFYSPESPLYFGCKFKHKEVVYMSGGAGYVLSRKSLRFFIEKSIANNTDSKSCRAHTDSGAEDLELGRCLQSVGCIAGDSRDASQKPRFFPFDPLKIVWPHTDLNALAPWFSTYSVYPHTTGPECCSPTLISFHYVTTELMYLMDFLLYKVNVIQ